MPIPHQPELFPLSTGFRPATTLTEPLLWIRELRVYRLLSPGDHNLIRRIELHPGLNVLWARPGDRTRTAQLHTPGVSGHGTGKSTFCRFVRHVLGEPTFGSEEQRQRLRQAFPEGWIVAEVRIAGESWLVCRPFKIGSHTVCYRGRTIETLFADENGRATLEDYLCRLDAVLAEPLPVATFATDPTPIRWAHMIQWLARDQECRFAALADVRHPTSEAQSPDMTVEDRHFLFRAVLGLIDTAEQSELEKHKGLLARRTQAEKNAPLLRFRSASTLKRLRPLLPDFRADLEGAAFLETAANEWRHQAETAGEEFASMTEPESLRKAREQLIETERLFSAIRHRVAESQDLLDFIGEQRRKLRGEIGEDELTEFIRRKFPPDRYCAQPLSAAIEFECPLVQGRLLPMEAARSAPALNEAEKLDAQERSERIRLAAETEKMNRQQAAVDSAQSILQQETEKFDRIRTDLAGRAAEARALAADAQRAFDDQEEADRFEKSLDRLDKQLEQSLQLQTKLREQNYAALSAFADVFGRIARAIFGDQVKGEIRFRGRQIRPTLTDGIDLTSAALETLKIICFDLAALVHAVEGRGSHARFLMHDGPREADLDAELYQRIFLLMAELEAAFSGAPISFQHIVTSTEPPPPDMQRAPWLLSPVLSAAASGEKFLGQDF